MLCSPETVKIDTIEAVVVFVDISGFKQYIAKDEKKASEALSSFSTTLIQLTKEVPNGMKKISYQHFSDCAYLWYEYSEEEEDEQIKYLFEVVSELQYRLFVEFGLCIRGGVNKGRVFLSRTLSGTTVNETYRMESEVAKWFRIAISDDVIKLFHSEYDNYIYKDIHDEGCTVNFLRIMCEKRNYGCNPHEIMGQYRKKIVPDIYDESTGQYFLNPSKEEKLGLYIKSMRLLLKYQDLISYYNLVCGWMSCRRDIIFKYHVPDTLVSKSQLDKHLYEYSGGDSFLINNSLNSLISTFNRRKI